MYRADGLGVATDFVDLWVAGLLVFEGYPALAYDWDIQKQIELALLRQVRRLSRLALPAAISLHRRRASSW